MRLAVTVLALVLAVLGRAEAQQITVFAAASLAGALDEANAGYTGATVTVAYAGSSALARQIADGAPADVFISANAEWMDEVQKRGLLVPGSRRDLLSNRLVVVAHGAKAAPLPDLAALPEALGDGRLALGLTEAVPAGIYARQALTSAGLWDTLKSRTAETDNVRVALQLVALGEAPFGIVYATDAMASAGVSVVLEIDPALYEPVVYPAAAIAGGDLAAADYLDYLGGPAAAAVFAAHGFVPPDQ